MMAAAIFIYFVCAALKRWRGRMPLESSIYAIHRHRSMSTSRTWHICVDTEQFGDSDRIQRCCNFFLNLRNNRSWVMELASRRGGSGTIFFALSFIGLWEFNGSLKSNIYALKLLYLTHFLRSTHTSTYESDFSLSHNKLMSNVSPNQIFGRHPKSPGSLMHTPFDSDDEYYSPRVIG